MVNASTLRVGRIRIDSSTRKIECTFIVDATAVCCRIIVYDGI